MFEWITHILVHSTSRSFSSIRQFADAEKLYFSLLRLDWYQKNLARLDNLDQYNQAAKHHHNRRLGLLHREIRLFSPQMTILKSKLGETQKRVDKTLLEIQHEKERLETQIFPGKPPTKDQKAQLDLLQSKYQEVLEYKQKLNYREKVLEILAATHSNRESDHLESVSSLHWLHAEEEPNVEKTHLANHQSHFEDRETVLIRQGKGGEEVTPLIETEEDSVQVPGETLHTKFIPSQSVEVVLLVIDLVGSTRLVIGEGDTFLLKVVDRIRQTIMDLSQPEDLLFLKCTGDGFLVVFKNADKALNLAIKVQENSAPLGIQSRSILHAGRIKTDTNGEPLGKEVHRTFRMEKAVADFLNEKKDLTNEEKARAVVASEEFVQHLHPELSTRFKPGGVFPLKDFDQPAKLWLYHY